MSELKIWTDGEDWYIADSAEQAAALRGELIDDELDDSFRLASDPLTMSPDQGAEKVTQPQAAWIAEAGGKPGHFASLNW